MNHENMLQLMLTRYTEASAEQKAAYLEAFANRFDIDIKTVDFEQTIELFEDTRTEDQVNEMMPFLTHIGIHGYTWSAESNIYIREGILKLTSNKMRVIDISFNSLDVNDDVSIKFVKDIYDNSCH